MIFLSEKIEIILLTLAILSKVEKNQLNVDRKKYQQLGQSSGDIGCQNMSNLSLVDKTFINPCNCKGSSQWVHIQCIQRWICSTKRNKFVGKQGSYMYMTCELCQGPIYFTIEAQSWISWFRTKPCSATFYFCWIFLLILSFLCIATLVVFAIVTEDYLIFKYLGLPLGFLLFGGLLFAYCGKDFKDYKTGLINVKKRSKKNVLSEQVIVQIENISE